MGRKPINLGPSVEAQIEQRAGRGETPEFIAAALGGTVSAQTVRRRIKALHGNAQPPGKPTAVAEDVPEEVPENTPLEVLTRWLARVEKGAAAAEAAGNLPALSSLAMRAASLAEAIRKATPIPKADPNDNPDYQKLADEGEARWLRLITGLFPDGRVPS